MSPEAIQKLRRKFISITMMSVFIVLLIIGAAVNLISYAISISSIKNSLAQILERELVIEQDDDDDDFQPYFRIFAPEYINNRFYILTYDKDGFLTKYTTNVKDSETEFEVVSEYAKNLFNGRKTFGRKSSVY